MPYCWKCNQPILFVPVLNDGNEPSDKSFPVNLSPDASGTLALMTFPFTFRNRPPENGRPQIQVARRMYGEAARMFKLLGGSLYRIHYDTCTGSKPNHYGR